MAFENSSSVFERLKPADQRLQAKLLVAFGHDFLYGAENAKSLR